MPIIRHAHKKGFTILFNTAVRDPALSLKGVGLLATLMSLPDNWEFSFEGLASILPHDGLNSVRSAADELSAAGYLERCRERDPKGRLGKPIWYISDVKGSANIRFSNVGESYIGKPYIGKSTTNKIPSVQSTDSTKEREGADAPARSGKTSFIPPEVKEVEAYCTEQGYNLNAAHFLDYYAARGWRMGNAAMSDWKAAVRSWVRRRGKEFAGGEVERDFGRCTLGEEDFNG